MGPILHSRRALLRLPAALAVARTVWGQAPEESKLAEIPMQGAAGTGLEGVDQRVREQMARDSVPGAALAVARGGALVLSRGYGWANKASREPVTPETLFGLARVSKSLTAVALLKLVETGKLDLDARAFALIDQIRPIPGDAVDPRISVITVRQLLQHSAGWDRKVSGDASGFSQRVAERLGLGVGQPVAAEQLIQYMLGQKLDFDPGSSNRYSNFGYVVLGAILARVTGQPFGAAVRTLVLHPLGLDRVRLDLPRGKGYLPGEAHRYGPRGREDQGGGHLLITMASGGWLASAVDMVRFLVALDGTRSSRFLFRATLRSMTAPPPAPGRPRADGTYYGLGWDQVRRSRQGPFYCKVGSLLGMGAHLEHTEGGLDWALLWNGGRLERTAEEDTTPALVKEVRQTLKAVELWPELDLFAPPSAKDVK